MTEHTALDPRTRFAPRRTGWLAAVTVAVVALVASACSAAPPIEERDTGRTGDVERPAPDHGDHGDHGDHNDHGDHGDHGDHSDHGDDVGSGDTPAPSDPCSSGEAVSCAAQNSSGQVFREVFNGNPSSPTPVMNALDRWYAQPTVQGPTGWALEPRPMQAQHGADCGPPPNTHEIRTFEQTVYICRDHLMTAVNPPSTGTSSAVVSLKPNHMVDLSGGEASIKVDVSTLSPSKGDWWEIWITPYEDHLIAPVDHWFHQAGPPRRAVMFMVADLDNKKFFSPKVFDNYRYAGGIEDFWNGPNIRPIVSVSDTRRDTYEIRMTKDRVRMFAESAETGEMVKVHEFSLPGDGFWTDQAVVQFQQSNYEPELDGKFGANPRSTVPATWHWDNVEISPAVPYTIIGVDQHLVWYGSPSKRLDFDAAAPTGSDLMFTAMSWGNSPELSFDGGVTWTAATAVRPPNDPPIAGFGGDPDLLTYRVAVPPGATSAEIRGRGGCVTCSPGFSWGAMNFHLIAPPS